MSALEQLYQQLILDHAKNPHAKGLAEVWTGESFQVNPMCGDRVQLRVELDCAADGAPHLAQVSWDGAGCSISQASVSVMSEMVAGLGVEEVERLEALFLELMHSRGAGVGAAAEEELGDAVVFEGVSKYPARIKCALLGWMALKDAIARSAAGDASPARIPEGL